MMMKFFLFAIFLPIALCAQTRGFDARAEKVFFPVSREAHCYSTSRQTLTSGAENLVTWDSIDSTNVGRDNSVAGNGAIWLYHPGRWICDVAAQFENISGSAAVGQLKLRLNGNLIAGTRTAFTVSTGQTIVVTRRFVFDVADADTTDGGRATLRLYAVSNQSSCALSADSSSYSVSMSIIFQALK